MKTRRKRIARPKRSASRQRFRIKAPRLPKLQVPKSQQRELAGIGFLLLAGLLVLAVALQASGSAMHLLRGGLVGLFGWGVVWVMNWPLNRKLPYWAGFGLLRFDSEPLTLKEVFLETVAREE